MAGHVAHLAVPAALEPALQVPLVLIQVDFGDSDGIQASCRAACAIAARRARAVGSAAGAACDGWGMACFVGSV